MTERWPYGPNTLAVRRFLQQFAALAPDERAAIAREFAAAEQTPRFQRADRALAAVIPAGGRDAERDAALRPLAQLLDAGGPDDGEAALDEAAPAAVAAVLALVARDLLPPEVFETLYAPFAARIPLARLD